MVKRILIICHLIFSLLSLLAVDRISCKGKIRKFPPDFKFGAATAAYQIEGGWNADDKGLSIWDVATHASPSPIKDQSNGDQACDSYNQWSRDVDLAKELGLDFYRFSISWPRILPDGFADKVNQAGLNYYSRLIDELHEKDIIPFVTIYHWDLPENLQKLGGWANPHIVDWFTDYARILFDKFSSKVKFWITINEPKQICVEGYGSDEKAPFLNVSGVAEYICAKNVLLAHAKAYRLYDSVYRKLHNGSIGISVSCSWYEPASESPEDVQAAQDARMFDWGLYTHPIFHPDGGYPKEVRLNVASKSAEQGLPRSRLIPLSEKEILLLKGSSDFFGMNTYTSKLVYRDQSLEGMYAVPSFMDDMSAVLVKENSWPQAESSWLQEVPWGFYKLLKEVKKLYHNPQVYVTENGWSTSGGLVDESRIHYLRRYLNALLNAISEGCRVRAYTVWSLMDNFEWKNGYTEKFGLYEVDFLSHDKIRTPRKSAFVYKEVVRSRQLDPNFEPANYLAEAFVENNNSKMENFVLENF